MFLIPLPLIMHRPSAEEAKATACGALTMRQTLLVGIYCVATLEFGHTECLAWAATLTRQRRSLKLKSIFCRVVAICAPAENNPSRDDQLPVGTGSGSQGAVLLNVVDQQEFLTRRL